MNGGNSLPNITSPEALLPALKQWQQKLNGVVNKPRPARPPYNTRVSSISGSTSILIEWEPVRGADGYQVFSSPTGDFSNRQILATLTSPTATSFVHDLGATGKPQFYAVASTSGTVSQPQSVLGKLSAAITNTSGSGTTVYDQTTGNGRFDRASSSKPGPGRFCFSGNTEIRMADGSYTRFDELPTDETFEILNQTGTHTAKLIVHTNFSGVMIDFDEGRLVTTGHLIKLGTEWREAREIWPNAPRVRVSDIPVYNLEVVSLDPADKHYVLRNRLVAHNLKAQF